MICVAVATFSTPSTRSTSAWSRTVDRGRRASFCPAFALGLVTEPALSVI
ncbi:hypothetical protein [Actinacidiphila epipremni]|uniref:Uncharacterized protein n=1 Tax=Actinacidiphila epipremni TaxID=2053013 RepID=A0ABX1A2H9_9ACTN|nr:hypothetical protein [Actinacidiphila epipremni]NJP47798.1 hypothetical protein [Actinacidiphila epipremni]